MPFLFLLLLVLACLPENWPAPLEWWNIAPSPALSAGLTWGGIAGFIAAAAVIARWVQRRLKDSRCGREALIDRYSAWRGYHLFGLVGFYGLALYFFGWGWTIHYFCTPAGPLEAGAPPMYFGAELFILAPFIAGLLLSWACFYDADRALDETSATDAKRPFWGRGAYISFRLRQNLALLAAPLLLLIIEKGLQRLFPDYQTSSTFVGVIIGLLISVFVTFPWILRLVLGLKPLPAGPLRDRLLGTARRLKFRFSNVLLWDTHGGVANAMVAGLLPLPRYVILTDRLVEDLSADEVEAVFGHEVGHVKHLHMVYYLGFIITSLSAMAWLYNLAYDFAAERLPVLASWLPPDGDAAMVPFLGVLAVYIFLVFGFLSRRCERQADVYGCRTVSCAQSDCLGHGPESGLTPGGRGLCPTGIRTFIEALEKVAQLNGMSRSKPGWLQSWQHSTIARRVEFLQRVIADRSEEQRFQRTVWRMKWALAVVLALLLGGLYLLPSGSRMAPVPAAFAEPPAGWIRPDEDPSDWWSDPARGDWPRPHRAGRMAPWE